MKRLLIVSLVIISSLLIIGFMMKKNNTVTIGLGGDTMLGRLTNETINTYGCSYIWGDLLPTLQSTDFNLVNLETTFTQSVKKVPKTFNFKADPQNVQCLSLANIQCVNLANNHMLDFSDEGLIETLQTLNDAHIHHVGAGLNQTEAAAPVIIEKNGIKIGIVGYADYPKDWMATDYLPGIHFISIANVERIKKDIETLKKVTDIVIVSIHWGPNFSERPSEEFVHFAHAIIDAGADILHGHSAHIFQGIEEYKNKLIFYDMGELIDDYAVDPLLRNDRGIFAKVTVAKNDIKNFEITPIFINMMQVNKATGEDYNWIINRLHILSTKLR